MQNEIFRFQKKKYIYIYIYISIQTLEQYSEIGVIGDGNKLETNFV